MNPYKFDTIDEGKLSAAMKLARAWDRQRALTQASMKRTPSSIPKKEEGVKRSADTVKVSEDKDYSKPIGKLKDMITSLKKDVSTVVKGHAKLEKKEKTEHEQEKIDGIKAKAQEKIDKMNQAPTPEDHQSALNHFKSQYLNAKRNKDDAGATDAARGYHDYASKLSDIYQRKLKEENNMNEAANPSVGVSIHMSAPEDKKYSVTEFHPKKSPRGRVRWKDVSHHSSADEATKAADAHATKHGYHRLKKLGEMKEEDRLIEGSYRTNPGELSRDHKSKQQSVFAKIIADKKAQLRADELASKKAIADKIGRKGVAEGLKEMDNRTPSGDRREKLNYSPEEEAKKDKEQQKRLTAISPEMRKKLRLPEPKLGVAEGYWQDALKKAEADRAARQGMPFKKNPASHDKKGVYKGDKDLAGNPVPKRKEQGVKEEVVNPYQLIEKLSANAKAGDYIADFEKSKAPQFKDKPKAKRVQMAIAAYMASKGKRA